MLHGNRMWAALWALGAALALFTGLARADTAPAPTSDNAGFTDPYQMVQDVAGRTFDRFHQDQSRIDADLEYLKVIVDEEMMPYVDHKYAAYKVMGPSARKSTPEQRQRFTDAFRQYMIAVFAQAFTQYNEQQAEYLPPKPYEGRKIVAIGVSITEQGKEPIAIQFKARRSKKTGHWRVFDMVAEGVSLLATKEAEIGGLIRSQGIDSVTQQLAEKSQAKLVRSKVS